DLVDCHRARADRNAGADSGLPRRRLADRRLQHVAHDHLLDLVRTHPRVFQRAANSDRPELRRRHRRKRSLKRSDRRPCAAENDDVFHVSPCISSANICAICGSLFSSAHGYDPTPDRSRLCRLPPSRTGASTSSPATSTTFFPGTCSLTATTSSWTFPVRKARCFSTPGAAAPSSIFSPTSLPAPS